jgi:hypothetical protein
MNDVLADVEPLGRLLFAGLWCIADREGRLEDRPRRIKAEVLPYDDCDINELLNQLAKREFIIRYEVDGEGYIQVTNFTKHQNPHKNERDSEIPAPDNSSTSTVQVPEMHNTNRADSLNMIPDSLNIDQGSCPNSASSDDDCPPDEKSKQPQKKFGEEHIQLAEHLKNRILANKPDARVPESLDSWADTFRLMVERDGRSCQQIAAVIDWCQNNDFWRANILSASKLREKFDQLELQMQRPARADPQERIPRGFAGLIQMREEIEERERKRGAQPSRAGPS